MDAIELPLDQIIPETMWTLFLTMFHSLGRGVGVHCEQVSIEGEGLISVKGGCKTW